MPIFRSSSQLAVLDAVLSSPEPVSTSDVIRATGLSQPLAHRELRRLADAGVFRETRVGRSALFVADDSNPAVAPLRALTAIAVGPQKLIETALQGIDGIDRALIFGSFAARAAGIPGKSPGDVDVLIIGTPERRSVYDALDAVDAAVRREVNVSFVRPERWELGEDELVRRVKENPIIELAIA